MNINFYNNIKKHKVINPNLSKHKIDVPFRMLISAPSGSGKTNSLCNLIYQMDKTFHEIIICVLSADEPLYEMLDQKLKNLKIYEGGEIPDIEEFSIKDANNKLKKKDNYQRLIIFDDLMLNKDANNKISKYYIKGRKLNFSMAYLSQSFYGTPKIIRDNCNIFILGKNLLNRDLNNIALVFPTNMNFDQFLKLYTDMTKNNLDFIVIDINKRTITQNLIGVSIQF